MLYDKIRAYLDRSPYFGALREIPKGAQREQHYHLNQSARALAAADIFMNSGKNLIIVSQDDIIAEDIWDDLCVLIGRDKAYYLPDYEILLMKNALRTTPSAPPEWNHSLAPSQENRLSIAFRSGFDPLSSSRRQSQASHPHAQKGR
jgi:hypothetical protein